MGYITEERTIEANQVRKRMREIEGTVYAQRTPLGRIEAVVTGLDKGPERAPRSGWRAFEVLERWGGFDQTTWFRMKARIPAAMKGQKVVALIRPGGESLAYVNGKTVPRTRQEPGRTPSHRPRERRAKPSTSCSESVPSTRFDLHHHFEYADLAVMRPAVWEFWWDCQVALEVWEQLPEASAPARKLLELLKQALYKVDLQHIGEAPYFDSIPKARRFLRNGLKAFENSFGMGSIGVIPQSHIDTAWLWPLRETRRKCARTFSTVLNLLDRYPDACFMASQPVQYEWIKTHYPELYRRIKRYVKAGRWEVMGGMWVETDCNVPSGESFVRQLLYGNRFYRKEFGIHTRTAWLPDTFGDSWALPQILKKAQIDHLRHDEDQLVAHHEVPLRHVPVGRTRRHPHPCVDPAR